MQPVVAVPTAAALPSSQPGLHRPRQCRKHLHLGSFCHVGPGRTTVRPALLAPELRLHRPQCTGSIPPGSSSEAHSLGPSALVHSRLSHLTASRQSPGRRPGVLRSIAAEAAAELGHAEAHSAAGDKITLAGAWQGLVDRFNATKPPRWLWRSVAALMLGGQVLLRILQGKVHVRNTVEQLGLVGPRSLGVALLTAGFVGMVFTIQFVREFAKLGLTRSVGGVLALALSRELTPVVTCIILAGRVGSAFAAELGTMQVSEQTDSLRVLGTDPVDYLVSPRVLACMIAAPILCVLCFAMGMGASVLLADTVYDVGANVILDSAARALRAWDVITSIIKSWVFGTIISVVSCSWGFTTSGGAKGVGESTTSAVVISLVLIFIADFLLSFLFFQGQGDALKQLA